MRRGLAQAGMSASWQMLANATFGTWIGGRNNGVNEQWDFDAGLWRRTNGAQQIVKQTKRAEEKKKEEEEEVRASFMGCKWPGPSSTNKRARRSPRAPVYKVLHSGRFRTTNMLSSKKTTNM